MRHFKREYQDEDKNQYSHLEHGTIVFLRWHDLNVSLNV